jgi:hypothetical protein
MSGKYIEITRNDELEEHFEGRVEMLGAEVRKPDGTVLGHAKASAGDQQTRRIELTEDGVRNLREEKRGELGMR